jgi:hypothetical protein
MLNIFADALLIAARQDPLLRHPERRHPDPQIAVKQRRKWLGLMGVRL